MSATSPLRQQSQPDHVEAWLDQFAGPDREVASNLLGRIRHVSASEFDSKFYNLINQRLSAGPTPLAFYVEREWGHRGGKAYRLFREPDTKRNRRAAGNGPPIVAPRRTVRATVGSEGIVANIASRFARADPRNVYINPGPDQIRPSQPGEPGIRRFVLVADFIGSGDRAYRFLDAAWNVRSVRSWWSLPAHKGWSFEVVAFAATEHGRDRVERHPCKPIVHVCEPCPSIKNSFSGRDKITAERLCARYDPTPAKDDPLGYGGAGILMTFAHGMPNNAPTIFHRKGRRWVPLYPKRVTSELQPDSERSELLRRKLLDQADDRLLRSPTFAAATKPLREAVRVTSIIARGGGGPLDLAATTGLTVSSVQDATDRAQQYGWIDSSGRVTERGKAELRRVRRAAVRSTRVPSGSSTRYVPDQLRVPSVT